MCVFYRRFQGNSIESKHGGSNCREFALFSSLKNTQCIDFTIKALNSMWGIKFLVLVPTVSFAFGIVPGWRLIRWICLLVTMLLSQWTTGCAFLLWLWCFVFSHFAIPFHPTVRFEIPFHAVVPLIWLTKMFYSVRYNKYRQQAAANVWQFFLEGTVSGLHFCE